MCGRRLAQWHVLQPKMAAPGQLLDAQTPWCGALQSDSPWSSHSDVSGLEDCRPQTCDLHPRIAETQRGGASQGPRGGGFRCTGACVERRPKARQFNDILHSNMLKNPTRRTFDLGYRSTDLELPQDQPTVALVGLWRLLSPGTGWYSTRVSTHSLPLSERQCAGRVLPFLACLRSHPGVCFERELFTMRRELTRPFRRAAVQEAHS